jgi:hypothetical protein
MKKHGIQISWVAQIIAAIILAQTLFFKFIGAPESVAIFTKLGVEPFGRYVAGVMELITVILLVRSKTSWLGAIVGLATMAGALLAHFTVIGIESDGDGGLLFSLAIITAICCALVAFIRKSDLLVKFHLNL